MSFAQPVGFARDAILGGATLLLAGVSASHSASAQIAVMTNTVEERTAAPGEKYAGTILVRNLTAQTQPVRVYQSDYTFFANGTSHFDAPGTVERSNAKWITPSAANALIPPQGEVTVSYTVQVPVSDTLRGTFWSTVMVEAAVSPAPAASGRQVSLGTVTRYAVQIATHVSGTGTSKTEFGNQHSLSEADGSKSLEVDLSNVGERAYRPLLWVELYDATGAVRAKVQQQRGLLYPGTSLRQKFVLGKLPAGDYKAAVFADAGDDATFAAQYKLHF
jgi:hypothetical protein